jgi:prepilin-type N-terminal cleavage/methylation domain-containing protein
MRHLKRGGFTLVEMIVVLGLMGVVLAALYQAIRETQRTTNTQVQRMDVQQSTRAVGLYLGHLLRELDAADGDVLLSGATSMRIRSMAWTGVLCTPPAAVAGRVQFTIARGLLFGMRAPDAALDSVLLYADGDPSIRTDDVWLMAGLTDVAAGACPDASPGTVLDVDVTAGSGGSGAALADVSLGSPVRGFTVEELSLYLENGNYWLGRRTADRAGTWSSMRPLIGPLETDGLAFTYFDAAGATPALTTGIVSIGLTVRARSAGPVSGQGYLSDSIITRVALRNNRRF